MPWIVVSITEKPRKHAGHGAIIMRSSHHSAVDCLFSHTKRLCLYSVQDHILHCKTSSAAKTTPASGNPVCMALDLLLPHPFPPPSQRRGVQTNGPFTQSVCRPGLRLANPSSQIHRSCVCPLTWLGDPCLCDFQLLVSHQSLPLFVVRAWYANHPGLRGIASLLDPLWRIPLIKGRRP